MFFNTEGTWPVLKDELNKIDKGIDKLLAVFLRKKLEILSSPGPLSGSRSDRTAWTWDEEKLSRENGILDFCLTG